MNKIKRLIALVVCVLLVVATVPAVAQAEGDFTVHVKAPDEWTSPGLWAWSAPDGTNVFASWPGEKLLVDENNSGWFYYNIPSWANSVIVNEGVDGGKQTIDFSVESKEMWITLTEEDAEGKYDAEITYEAPEGFVVSTSEVEQMAPKTGDNTYTVATISLIAALGFGFLMLKSKKKNKDLSMQ
ncbi:MAG: starch-binding protein [Herbinix sp.]|nr:starch-binding protein [Herbinix sp.]